MVCAPVCLRLLGEREEEKEEGGGKNRWRVARRGRRRSRSSAASEADLTYMLLYIHEMGKEGGRRGRGRGRGSSGLRGRGRRRWRRRRGQKDADAPNSASGRPDRLTVQRTTTTTVLYCSGHLLQRERGHRHHDNQPLLLSGGYAAYSYFSVFAFCAVVRRKQHVSSPLSSPRGAVATL